MENKSLIRIDLELHQILREDLNCYLLHPEEIKRVFEKQRFFSGLQKKDDLEEYIQKVTGMLIDKSSSKEFLFEKYISAAAICVFAEPLIVKSLDEKIVSHFLDTVRRSPYSLEYPLLLFQDRDSGYLTETELIRSEFNTSIIDIDKENITEKFERSNHFKKMMREKLIHVSGSLRQRYSEKDYFSFVGFYHVCRPLFGVRESRADYSKLYGELKEKYGSFHLLVPNSLATDYKQGVFIL